MSLVLEEYDLLATVPDLGPSYFRQLCGAYRMQSYYAILVHLLTLSVRFLVSWNECSVMQGNLGVFRPRAGRCKC